jgi:uncharacterized protein YbjQ (UPF0145 family)
MIYILIKNKIIKKMYLASASIIPNRKYDIMGTCIGSSVLAMSALRRLAMGFTGIFGAKQNFTGIEERFDRIINESLQHLENKAKLAGADAVIGVQYNISEMGQSDSVICCSSIGTMVKFTDGGNSSVAKGGKRMNKKNKNLNVKKRNQKKNDKKN